MAGNTPLLNALNTRYVILDDDYPPLLNEGANGAAWFVDSVVPAETPDAEIALLGSVDLRRQAIVATSDTGGAAPSYTPAAPGLVCPQDTPSSDVLADASVCHSEERSDEESSDRIVLTSYAPNRLVYNYSAAEDRLAVFSEIYYPNGWHATVDGEPLQLLRADWTLRAALLPAGTHEVEMTFLPDSYRTGATVSRIASIVLYLLLLLALAALFLPPSRASRPE
jgi:hypothetical protein